MSKLIELMNKKKTETVSIQVKIPRDIHMMLTEYMKTNPSLSWQDVLMAAVLDFKEFAETKKRKTK